MTKAILVHQTGGPEVLSFEDHAVGAPGAGQVALRQTAIGLNFIDTYQRAGLYPVQLPFVAGNEAVGVVTALGDGVTDFKIGDRVAYQGLVGAYAQERLVTADRLVPIPDAVDDQTAAAILLKGLTAYYLLFKTWAVARDETILWHAAAGGTGLIATQWAKALGATVIGTAGSDDKTALASAHGCDHVINYTTEDFAERVREITDGRGVDVVYDGVGKATFEKSLDCVRPRGLLASFGNASGVVAIPDITVLARKGSLYVTRPTGAHYFSQRAELLEGAKALFDAVASGAIKVQVNHSFPLAQAADAHRALESRQTTGSVVLIP
ncbi:quinone oxidoreductase [Devosia neptuniae]|jgi:NADPH2:quinone reductase|uniref:quinone oxidoreductase family protein n=1 Tax=Devosia neptuniae TaxID=191302 RepID=UPI0022AE5547|nr:quinone oxidoreductase [Devosia neptuniae]MCZ4346372.1 quinone oxidoreductase [Devosia neptuniae]|tara:strand:+ start:37321 stop:38292 length:972 start_codon:yes stop_codon:yes gene_type:complete